MNKKASYTLLRDWGDSSGPDWSETLGSLSSDQSGLLCSDASMTMDLESLLGTRLAVELRLMGTTTIDSGEAAYLGEAEGSTAFEREVWLTAEGRRVLYARTLIPIDRIEPELRALLEKEQGEPLGRVLNSRKVPFSKDRLELGVIRCAALALDLGCDEDTPLVARRYILSSGEGGRGRRIKASVTEIFSPELVSGAPAKTPEAPDE